MDNTNKILNKLAVSLDWRSAALAKPPTLNKGELHIWCLPLTLSTDQQSQTLSWLSDQQINKYSRRRTTQLQEAYLAGRYYLLSLLAAYSNCRPEDIKLSYTHLNKPYLSGSNSHLHFNFTDTQSGSESIGLLAFCLDQEVGVDVEALDRRNRFELIAQKRFTPEEQALVINKDGTTNTDEFLCVWTRKEASGKATGQGINFKMNQRNLVDDLSPTVDYWDEQRRAWRLTQLRLESKFIGCVAHSGHTPLKIKAFNQLDC